MAAFLGVIACCPRGNRIAGLVIATLAAAALSFGLYALRFGRFPSGFTDELRVAYSICGSWLIPLVGAVLLLKGRFSFRRFCARLAFLWLLITAVQLILSSLFQGFSISATSVLLALASPLPFFIGLLLFLRLSRWSREGFLRGLDLTEAAAQSAAAVVAPGSE